MFTTVHANNVVDVIGRFLNMGVEPYNFVSALNCILAQRLVRLICESCRTVVHYPSDVLEASGLDPGTVVAKSHFMKGRDASNAPARGSAAVLRFTNCSNLSDHVAR